MMKSIDQQQSDLKHRLTPVFLGVLVAYLVAAIPLEEALRGYFASTGMGLGLVRLLVPIVLCAPLALVYASILWFVCLRCPSCMKTVRRPTYRALARLRQCPGCGCEWSAGAEHSSHGPSHREVSPS
jgi:hypothetical protein